MEMGAAENRSLGEKGKGGVVKVIKKEKARIDRVVESSRGLPWFPLRFSVFFFYSKSYLSIWTHEHLLCCVVVVNSLLVPSLAFFVP